MEDIYKDTESAQQSADELRKSRDVPLFLQMHQFYAKVLEDVIEKSPKEALLSIAVQPVAQPKPKSVEQVREGAKYLKMPDLWLIIFSYLDIKTLGRISQASHFCYYVSENDKIWRPFYETKFGNENNNNSSANTTSNNNNMNSTLPRSNSSETKRKAEAYPKEIQMTVLSKSVDSAHEQKSNANATTEQHQSFLGSLFHPHAQTNKKQASWKDKYRRTYLQILKEGPIWIKEREKGAYVSNWFLMWAVFRQRKLRIYKVKNDSIPFAIIDFHADTLAGTTMSLLSRHYGFYIKNHGYYYELGTDEDSDRQEWVKLFNDEIKMKQAEEKKQKRPL